MLLPISLAADAVGRPTPRPPSCNWSRLIVGHAGYPMQTSLLWNMEIGESPAPKVISSNNIEENVYGEMASGQGKRPYLVKELAPRSMSMGRSNGRLDPDNHYEPGARFYPKPSREQASAKFEVVSLPKGAGTQPLLGFIAI